MPLDSLGLGLTLDTTLLEKADKTLENMHKNSKLIMQNLTKGISAFNEGKISDFSRVFDEMAKSMDKLSKTTVSPDFDTKGLEKGLGYVTELTAEIEKMQRAGTKEFFNPENLYTTTKSLTEATLLLKYFRAEAAKVGDAIKAFLFNPIQISEAENKIKALKASLKGLSTDDDAYADTTLALKQEEDRLKDLEEELEAAKKAYGDLDSARLKSKEIIEQTAKAEQLVSWSSKTKAEQLAAITSYNNKIIAEERARTKEVETLYKNNFAEMQRISKSIAQLEADREKIAKAGGDTTEQDINLAFYRDQLQKRIELEEEITKSGYQKIAKIKEELNAKAFLDSSKQQVKSLETEVAFANRFSKNAKTINEEKEAIKLLTAARDNLSTSTAHYDQVVNALNKRIAKHEDHVKLLTHEQKENNELVDSVISRYIREKKEIKELNKLLKELHEKQASTGIKTTEEDKYEQDIIARRQRLWNDVHQIEVDNAKQIAQLKEKYDASVAEEKIQEIIKTNEKEKQEYAKLLDDLYALEKQKKSMEEAGGGVGDAAYDKLIQQENDLNNRKSQLEAKHQNDLDEIRKKHAKKRNDDEVRAFIEAQKERLRIAEETQKKMDAYNEKYGTFSKSTAETVIANFSGAKNINQHKQAIEELQRVRSKLDNTDAEYYETLKKLNREIHSHELFIRAAENESVRLGNSHRGLMDISGQLMRRLALVFSVSQMTQYFRKLVEVRGQFEKTEVALTSIVGSQEKSKKLMNQTIALAIKSPFTLQQLTGYTKQLAAYQVTYEKLNDTTKMLADVSAGLGVEMDRLILAFGQVKAANFLRATEVRQFTEAGFNILGELAKYYTELEGTMVSVGDVQERVTKRMVDFADVEEIFHRVTEAGGMFYDMQSRQAETLAGQWTNLQDRIDIMLNEIGTSGEGVLKFIVKFLASAIDNWEVLASSLKTAAAAFLVFKTYSLLAGDGIKPLAIQMGVLTDNAPKVLSLGQAFKTLGRVVGSSVTKIGASMSMLLTNPIFLAIAAIGALIGAGFSLYRHLDKMHEALKEQKDAFNEYTASLKKLSREYKKLDEFTEKLAKLEELKNTLNERGLKLSVEIEDVNAANIDQIFTENEEILQKSYELGLSVGNAITRGINAAQGNIFGWSTFGENLAEDVEDFAAKWNKLASYGMDAQMRAMENELEANKNASEAALTLYETIREGRKAERDEKGRIVKYLESEYEWTIRRAQALKDIQDLEDGSVTKNNKLSRFLRRVTRQQKELSHEAERTANKLAKEFGGWKKLEDAIKESPEEFSVAIQAEIDKQSWGEVEKWVYSQELHTWLGITPYYAEGSDKVVNDSLAKFQQDLIDARTNLEDKGEGYSNFFISTEDINKMEQFTDGLEGIQKAYDENIKKKKQLKDTTTEEGKAELTMVNAIIAEVERLATVWGYTLNNKGGDDDGKDLVMEKLKNRISLIKEMNKEYERLRKTFSEEESLEKVRKAYEATAKELVLDASTMDFTDAGTIKSLEDLLGKPEYAANEYVLELQKALDNFKVELGITTKQEDDEKLKNDIQKLFDQYDLTLELKKLNIPPELAKSLFNVDYLDLDGLKKAVQAQEVKFVGTDMEQDYEDFLKKINELSRKAQEDEAKEFINFLKKNLDEIKLVQDKGAHNIALADRLFGEGKITAEQYLLSIRQIVEDTNKEVAKINLEKFKDSSTYIKAMGNLAAYSRKELEGMISALQEQVGTNAGNMGADEIRAYYEAIERLVDQYDKLESPFQRGEINDLIEYLGLQKQLNQEKEKEVALEQRKTDLNVRLELLQTKLASQQASGDTQGANITQGLIKVTVNELKEVNGQLVSVTSNISVISEKVANLGDGMVKSLVVAQKVVNEIANIAEASTKMFDDIKSAADALGADTESGGWAKAGYAMEMVGGVSSELTSGLANLASGNFAGALANVVGIVTKLISGFAKIHDQNYQDIIEAQAKEVERLGKAYEKLEKATEDAYSIEQLQQANKELERNVELQMQALRAMIAAERAKKNTDEEQIAVWNEELEALTQQWEDLKQSLVEGVGGVSDYRSQTREFVDSWVSAFKETGNGLSGLKDNFREFFDNIIAEQAALRVTEKFLAPFYDSLNTSLKDLKLTEEESKNLREEADKIMPELSKALELIWNQLGGSRGEADGGSLSALQKGIQGITEDTAQIIEAYLNSIRGMVSEQVTYTKKLYDMFYRMSSGETHGLNVRMIS